MEEGYAANKPLLFQGIKYDYQKERMIAHFKSLHIDMWDVVENGNNIPYDAELNEILICKQADEQKQRFVLNFKARNTFQFYPYIFLENLILI